MQVKWKVYIFSPLFVSSDILSPPRLLLPSCLSSSSPTNKRKRKILEAASPWPAGNEVWNAYLWKSKLIVFFSFFSSYIFFRFSLMDTSHWRSCILTQGFDWSILFFERLQMHSTTEYHLHTLIKELKKRRVGMGLVVGRCTNEGCNILAGRIEVTMATPLCPSPVPLNHAAIKLPLPAGNKFKTNPLHHQSTALLYLEHIQ